MKILIAGCGDVGIALAKGLVAEDHEVFALRRSLPSSNPLEGLSWVSADLCDPDSLEEIPGNFDAVVYTAAADQRSAEAYQRAYVTGVANLLGELKKSSPDCGHLIFVSSTGVYGEDDGEVVDEETPVNPRGFTGTALVEGESLVRQSGIPSTIVRFGGIYGPGRNWLIAKVRSGEAEILRNHPVYTNRIHRDDCAGVLQYLLAQGAGQGESTVYIGVDDEAADRSQVYEFLAQKLGVELMTRDAKNLASADLPSAGKQCSNKKLRDIGYSFIYPTYVEGYGSLLQDD